MERKRRTEATRRAEALHDTIHTRSRAWNTSVSLRSTLPSVYHTSCGVLPPALSFHANAHVQLHHHHLQLFSQHLGTAHDTSSPHILHHTTAFSHVQHHLFRVVPPSTPTYAPAFLPLTRTPSLKCSLRHHSLRTERERERERERQCSTVYALCELTPRGQAPAPPCIVYSSSVYKSCYVNIYRTTLS